MWSVLTLLLAHASSYDLRGDPAERVPSLPREKVLEILADPIFARVAEALDATSGGPIRNLVDSINNHVPTRVADRDGDLHATSPILRGSAWRGRDCDDSDGDVRPGRRPIDGDAAKDSNCNGIVGVDPASDEPYETTFCDPKDQRGVVVLGDSCAAHFTIDTNASVFFRELPAEALMEFDSPQCSWATGHLAANSTSAGGACPAAELPLDSFYLKLRERNRCNHRDFQNIGVNGARSTSMCREGPSDNCSYGIVNATARDRLGRNQNASVAWGSRVDAAGWSP